MRILVLDDGNRGNFNQAVGIAERIPGAEITVVSVPDLSLFRRVVLILSANVVSCLTLGFLRFLLTRSTGLKCPFDFPKPAAVISAGNRLAPVNLLLSRARLAKSIQVLWPDFIRISAFDLLVVPEHDLWRRRRTVGPANTLIIRGATNRIKPSDFLQIIPSGAGDNSTAFLPPGGGGAPAERVAVGGKITTIAVLVGGNDKNYLVSEAWSEALCRKLLELAEKLPARIYLTTSRRTPENSERVFRRHLSDNDFCRLVLYHETGANPVKEFLSAADLVLTTEDSINMVSEAASSGKPTVVLTVERRNSRPLVFDTTLRKMAAAGYIKLCALPELTPAGMVEVIDNPARMVLAETEKAGRKALSVLQKQKILVVGVSCLGDNLILSPAYRAIRRNFPDFVPIDVITDRRSAGYFENHPDFRKIYYYEKKAAGVEKQAFLSAIRRREYDFVFDFRNSIFGLNSGAKRRAVFYFRTGLKPRAGEHETDRWLRLLAYFLPLPENKGFYFPESRIDSAWLVGALAKSGLQPKGYAVLNPGGRWPKKRWSSKGFALLADRLQEKYGLASVLVGDRDEIALARDVAARSRTGPVNLAGQTTIDQLVTLLAQARVLVSNDSGTVHLASAAGCPTAVLFGPGDWRRYGPYRIPHIVISSGLDCSPCLRTECPRNFACWQKITPERVLEEVGSLISGKDN